VTDPISTSKSARESLARGLNALQADPSVPPQLVELAAPIAQAMGALHQIERTQQVAPHADVALNHVRGALGPLQAANSTHPAVSQALEAVATSLGLVHSLSRMANGPVPNPPPQPQAAPPQAAAPQQAAPQRTQEMAQKPVPPQMQPQMPAPQQPPPQAQQQRPAYQHAPQAPVGPPPGGGGMVARDPFAAPSGGHAAPLAAQMHAHAQQPVGAPATPSMPVPAPPAGNLQLVNADLGAHSATNFYKGLSGNDIFDHGGLFVSTYVLPKLGTPVRLKVSLPGGYEFEANAVVKWTREDGGADAPPGFGAAFTAITNEAKQLVLRYVRNREPILYDDF
jgi:hypothetical protein